MSLWCWTGSIHLAECFSDAGSGLLLSSRVWLWGLWCVTRFPRESSNFIDQREDNLVRGRNGGFMARKEVVKECPLEIVSVTIQVAISRRCRALSSRLGTTRKQEISGGEGMTDPHRWRGDGAWIRLRIFNTRK